MAYNDAFRIGLSVAIDQYVEAITTYERAFLRLFTEELVSETPVDTGLLRGSWSIYFEVTTVPDMAVPEPGGGFRYSPGPVTVARIMSKFEAGQADEGAGVFFLMNSAPYADAVEYGTVNTPERAYTRRTLAKTEAISTRAYEVVRGIYESGG